MLVFPNCKINIGLEILRRREDGYHDIRTVMYPVHSLYDCLEILPATEFSFRETGLTTGCPAEDNLCTKAYRLMEQRYDIGNVGIELQKNIPSGAGLGGGSSDAAFTIKCLNELFSLGISPDEMKNLASSLGSDVPFFIDNIPALAEGRGELLSPCKLDLKGKRLVMVKPGYGVGTAEAYAGVSVGVPTHSFTATLATNGPECWRDKVNNDFESSVFRKYPELRKIKAILYEVGAEYSSMSGSGSTIYGIFESRDNNPGHIQPALSSARGEEPVEVLKERLPGVMVFSTVL